MSRAVNTANKLPGGISSFTLFKLFVYGSLCFSGGQFIYEDLVAARLLLNGESSLADILNIFSVTIDTVSWLLLLVVFELETSILEDEQLQGVLKWSLNTLSALCYLVIIYAFTGYVGKLMMLAAGAETSLPSLCQMLEQGLVVMIDMDEYEALSAQNCGALSAEALGKIQGYPIIYQQSIYDKVLGLATVAAINSGAWILIVAVLQAEIVLQLRGQWNRHLVVLATTAKALLYGVLLLMAIYWGLEGDFVDFWDAFLWLAGFFIIELNVLNWQKESAQ